MAANAQAGSRLAGHPLCITIDDFPHQHDLLPDAAPAQLAEVIVEALARTFARHATGKPILFVNSDAMRPMEYLLERLAQIGPIGNHTASHCDLNAVPATVWEADVLRCQSFIEAHLGDHPRYFRFPFLRTGDNQVTKDAAYRFLADQGFTAVPGTCPTADWQFAEFYERAHRTGDSQRCAKLERDVISHIVAALENALDERDSSPIGAAPLVLVLHANRLLAAIIDKLLNKLCEIGLILDYPALSIFCDFEHHDEYIGNWGGSYLLQCTPKGREALGTGNDWLSLESARIASQYAT